MNKCKVLLMTVLFISFPYLFSGCSIFGAQPQVKAEVVMKRGNVLSLFHGGTQTAKALFCPGETVTVYRPYPQERLRYVEVGKVRIVRYLNDVYVEAVVMSGEVREGDLAMKAKAACMVAPKVSEE
jgi:hypothetical protein